jgi:hypothetical protein
LLAGEFLQQRSLLEGEQWPDAQHLRAGLLAIHAP